MTQPEALRRYKLTRRWTYDDVGICYRTGCCDMRAPGRAGGLVAIDGDCLTGTAWHLDRKFRKGYKSLPAALRAVERWLERAKEKKL